MLLNCFTAFDYLVIFLVIYFIGLSANADSAGDDRVPTLAYVFSGAT